MVDALAEALGAWPASAGLRLERGSQEADGLGATIAGAIARRWLLDGASAI